MTEGVPPGEEITTGEAEMADLAVSEAATAAQEKCTRSSVLTAVLRLKFRLSQQKEDLCTVENAFLTTENSKFILFTESVV
jgi:hypothetical protein